MDTQLHNVGPFVSLEIIIRDIEEMAGEKNPTPFKKGMNSINRKVDPWIRKEI